MFFKNTLWIRISQKISVKKQTLLTSFCISTIVSRRTELHVTAKLKEGEAGRGKKGCIPLWCQNIFKQIIATLWKTLINDIHSWIPTCLRVDQNTSRWYAWRFQGKQKEATARRCHLPTYATVKGKRTTSADSWIDSRCAMRRLAESCDWKRLLGVRKRTRGWPYTTRRLWT